MEQFLNKLVDFATHAGLKLIIAVLVLFLCSKGISLLIRRLKSGKGLAHMDPSVRSFLISALNIVLRLVLIVTVASYLGLPMTSVVTVIGSAGVAIGLALQGGLSNIASGMMILFFRPFSVEDYIEVNGQEGTVTAIEADGFMLDTAEQGEVWCNATVEQLSTLAVGASLTVYTNGIMTLSLPAQVTAVWVTE